MAKDYDPPEVAEHGTVTGITEGTGTNKQGTGSDEYSGNTPLTGSVF